MNNKELITELAKRLSIPQKNAAVFLQAFIEEVDQQIAENNQVTFLGTGIFETKQKEQRISVHPATQKRMLIPPKIVLQFKPVAQFKQALKNLPYEPEEDKQ